MVAILKWETTDNDNINNNKSTTIKKHYSINSFSDNLCLLSKGTQSVSLTCSFSF